MRLRPQTSRPIDAGGGSLKRLRPSARTHQGRAHRLRSATRRRPAAPPPPPASSHQEPARVLGCAARSRRAPPARWARRALSRPPERVRSEPPGIRPDRWRARRPPPERALRRGRQAGGIERRQEAAGQTWARATPRSRSSTRSVAGRPAARWVRRPPAAAQLRRHPIQVRGRVRASAAPSDAPSRLRFGGTASLVGLPGRPPQKRRSPGSGQDSAD